MFGVLLILEIGEYHDLYLKTDVLLLADVSENFRNTCLQYFRLDPCHYFSAPGLSWDALLRITKINLDLISDIDQQLFIEKGMQGGISYIAHRHAEANNKYMKGWNHEKESSYIMYLGANNLYGWAMAKPLPFRDLKWLDPESIVLENYTDDSKKGTIFIGMIAPNWPRAIHKLARIFSRPS